MSLIERKREIYQALVDSGGNHMQAANALGMDDKYLRRLIEHEPMMSRFKDPAKVFVPKVKKVMQRPPINLQEPPIVQQKVARLTSCRFDYIKINLTVSPFNFYCEKCHQSVSVPDSTLIDYFIGCATSWRKLHLECEDIEC